MKGRPNHFLRQFSSYVQRQANTEQNREAAALLLDRGLSNHIFPRLCLLDLILISTKCQLQLYKIELFFCSWGNYASCYITNRRPLLSLACQRVFLTQRQMWCNGSMYIIIILYWPRNIIYIWYIPTTYTFIPR